MRLCKAISLILFALVIHGCATTEGYKKVVSSWVGHTSEELFSSWGYPDSAVEVDRDTQALTYVRSRLYTTPVIATTSPNIYGGGYSTKTTGGQAVNLQCKTTFLVDKSSRKIKSWSFSGNDCRAPAENADSDKNRKKRGPF